MDAAWSRFKRTLTFRRKKKHDSSSASNSADGGKPYQWLEDEKKVREGTCSFQVKYLGNIEVTESRGMHVCEDAIKKLKSRTRGKQQRAILYVSGDALRVVDEITKLKSPTEQKGLIVDQTIEKVSFCSPDRNNEKAFAYICRDGTTRRWLCHCFLAVRDSGERLSHAVGCAFAVCLERKQQRERDCAVKAEFSDNRGTTFTRIGSFRQTTLTEKLLDPQLSQVTEPPPLHATADDTAVPSAIPRPRASEDLMYRRYSSMRLPSSASAYDYAAASKAVSTAAPSGPNSWNVPSTAQLPPNNPLLLPPPPASAGSQFRRSTSLRLDSTAAANVISRMPVSSSVSSQFSAGGNIQASMSTSSQLGAPVGMVPFPRSSSANAGFSTPVYGNVPTSVPPSIPEEDPWSSPANKQVSDAADAVTQLCEQLTAGLLSSSPQPNKAGGDAAFASVPQQNLTPLNVMSSPPAGGVSSPPATTSPFGAPNSANSSSRNPFLATASTASTPLATSQSAASTAAASAAVFQQQQQHNSFYSFVPSTTTTYFPAPSQWPAFPNSTVGHSSASPVLSLEQQQQQAAGLVWSSPMASNDPFSTSVGLSNSAVASKSNPFKDAPFIANF